MCKKPRSLPFAIHVCYAILNLSLCVLFWHTIMPAAWHWLSAPEVEHLGACAAIAALASIGYTIATHLFPPSR